jgi:excisionase family DNA binding protein
MQSLLSPSRVDVAQPSTLMPLCVGLQDAARLLSVSDRHLQKLTKRGEVPSARIGARVVYRVSALEQWLQGQEVKASN